jgi:RNA polymerase sigma-70 factor (ECF subfamily)
MTLAGRWRRARVPAAAAADTDEALVARAAAGDRAAFETLYERHVDTVWRQLTRLLGPDPEREDLTQQIFSELYDKLHRFRGDARFRTFLYRVVVNTAMDQLNRRRRRGGALEPDLTEAVPDAASTPEQTAERRERVATALDLLDRLKPKKRVAFLLRVVEGLSLEEVAAAVDATVPTVAQRVRHAQRELQALRERREKKS